MTNFTLNQQDAKQMKRFISDLFAQMTTDYQQTRSERKEVAAAFPPSDETFSVIEELELLTTDLRGYASQLQVRDWIENPAAAIDYKPCVYSVFPASLNSILKIVGIIQNSKNMCDNSIIFVYFY
jgi:hypothetical protein